MGETSGLLRELASLDEVECVAVTEAEQRREEAPGWAELKLNLDRGGKSITLWLRRHDAELIIEVLHEVLHPNAGGTIRSQAWVLMDMAYAALMENKGDPQRKGECLGLAQALALLENPYKPSIDAVRETARERHASR